MRAASLVVLLALHLGGCSVDFEGRAEPDARVAEDSGSRSEAGTTRDSSIGPQADADLDAGSDPGLDAGSDAGSDVGPTCVPAFEECNGLDDDCDSMVDEADACEGCTSRARSGGGVYLFCTDAMSWDAARRSCQSRGYDLVVVDGATEDAWLWSRASSVAAADWWIGLTDHAIEGAYIWVDGNVAWSDGVPHTYVNWRGGDPEDNAAEDCIELDQIGGLWADAACTQIQRFICEL